MAEASAPDWQPQEAHLQLLQALVRAHQDPVHPDIRTKGIEERDLAFEAGLLTPVEVEMTVYATQKRGRVLRLLREMGEQGWVEMKPVPPYGAYHIFLKDAGVTVLRERLRPWWSKLWERLRAKER
jgi:hypothetical protein